jgi:hypothetical protein
VFPRFSGLPQSRFASVGVTFDAHAVSQPCSKPATTLFERPLPPFR